MLPRKAAKVYFCDKCPYAAMTKSLLRKHRQAQHEGVRFPCDQCEYTSTTKDHLKRHYESKHLGKRIVIYLLLFIGQAICMVIYLSSLLFYLNYWISGGENIYDGEMKFEG